MNTKEGIADQLSKHIHIFDWYIIPNFNGAMYIIAWDNGSCTYVSCMMKIKLHSSCKIEDLIVETHLRKLCVILRSRLYCAGCVLIKDIDRRLPLELQV